MAEDRLNIPYNSFVQQLGDDSENPCAEPVSLCLPVFAVTDVAFQFENSDSFVCGYQAQLYVDGSPHGSAKDLIKVDVLGVDLVYFPDLSGMSFDTIPDGQCFYIRILKVDCGIPPSTAVLFQTACFVKIADECWTSVIKYKCSEDSFGFDYTHPYVIGLTTFQMYNKIRLPFYITEPQFNEKDTVFTLSNGMKKLLSSRVEIEYEAQTDWMPKQWHERLAIARSHDEFYVENVNAGYPITQQFMKSSDYEISWNRFLDHPTAQAKFKLNKIPYNNVNSNCS